MSRLDWLRPLALAGAVLCIAPACGGDDDDGPGGVDSGACPTAEALGSFDPLDDAIALHIQQPDQEDPTLRYLSVGADVSESRVDLLFIELWDDYTVFEGAEVEPGEFTIEGAETALQSCGVCVQLLVNVRLDGSGGLLFDKQYIATEGTVAVDSTGTREGAEFSGNYTGSVSDLTLTETDPTPMSGGVPLEGGCQTTIESASWDAVIDNGDE